MLSWQHLAELQAAACIQPARPVRRRVRSQREWAAQAYSYWQSPGQQAGRVRGQLLLAGELLLTSSSLFDSAPCAASPSS